MRSKQVAVGRREPPPKQSCRPSLHALAEPTTGITLRGAKRLMVSSWFGRRWAVVEPGARDTYLPIMWAEESAEVREGEEQGTLILGGWPRFCELLPCLIDSA